MEFSFDLCHGSFEDPPEKKEIPKSIKEIKEPIKIQPSEPIDIPPVNLE